MPFDDVRSPAAAPRGGILLQFRTERAPFVLMPLPDADLLEPDVDKMTIADLPLLTRVHMRRAEREIMRALGRPYDPRLNGVLVYVPLPELLENAPDFDNGVVRTSGKLTPNTPAKNLFSILDESVAMQIIPAGGAIQLLRSRAREWIGKDVIVSGTFRRPAISSNTKAAPAATYTMNITKIEPSEGLNYKGPARPLTLEQIVKNPPGPKDLVRVIGKYRGRDSFGDLPLDSRRNALDWVIKDQIFAVWVTGKQAAGQGFALDSSSQSDRETTWVAVTGTVEEREKLHLSEG